jgi:hypothetical protein
MPAKVRLSGESLKIMWPSCGLKMASPDLSNTNKQLLKLVIWPENKRWSSVSVKFPTSLIKSRAIYFVMNLDRSDHIGLNMTVVFFEGNIQLLEHPQQKQTVEITSAVTAYQPVTIATSGIISITYETCFPWQRLLSLVDKTLISILHDWIPARLFITAWHISQSCKSVNLQFVSKTREACIVVLYDIFNCNWVATRWQEFSTHIHTNNTENDTKQRIHRTTQKYIEQQRINKQIARDAHTIQNCLINN